MKPRRLSGNSDACSIKIIVNQSIRVTLDRLLHFGEHCAALRRRVKPRVAQLRKLTGRSWGLREPQFRTVANGYIRGALEHAAAAWLPAASSSHVQLLEREMHAAARVVTGCVLMTPVAPLMAEARLPTVRMRQCVLAAKMVCSAAWLPEEDPLRATADRTAPHRLTTTAGWRTLGKRVLALAEAEVPVEQRLPATIPPWVRQDQVRVCLNLGRDVRRDAPDDVRRATAEAHFATLPVHNSTWIWSDGSAEGGALLILAS